MRHIYKRLVLKGKKKLAGLERTLEFWNIAGVEKLKTKGQTDGVSKLLHRVRLQPG